jgi:DnaJ-domain-containing protein 1
MTKVNQAKRAVRNVDDMLYLFTGKRLRDVFGRGVTLFGDQITKKAVDMFSGSSEVDVPEDSPYRILGINPGAPDFLVRAAYKANMKKYHPDGETPDEEKSKLINSAYERICLEREIPK